MHQVLAFAIYKCLIIEPSLLNKIVLMIIAANAVLNLERCPVVYIDIAPIGHHAMEPNWLFSFLAERKPQNLN